MDDTLNRIAERLSQRRTELQEHLDSSTERESTTAELLDRVQRLKDRLNGTVPAAPEDSKE